MASSGSPSTSRGSAKKSSLPLIPRAAASTKKLASVVTKAAPKSGSPSVPLVGPSPTKPSVTPDVALAKKPSIPSKRLSLPANSSPMKTPSTIPSTSVSSPKTSVRMKSASITPSSRSSLGAPSTSSTLKSPTSKPPIKASLVAPAGSTRTRLSPSSTTSPVRTITKTASSPSIKVTSTTPKASPASKTPTKASASAPKKAGAVKPPNHQNYCPPPPPPKIYRLTDLPESVLLLLVSYLSLADQLSMRMLHSSLEKLMARRLIQIVKISINNDNKANQWEELDRHAQEALERYPKAEGMDFTHWTVVGVFQDENLQALPSRLKRLNLAGCRKVTDAAAMFLPPHLESLNLSNCFRITDHALSRMPSTLTSLNLSNCFKITDKGVAALPPSILKLNLIACFKVKNATSRDKGPDKESKWYKDKTQQVKEKIKQDQDIRQLEQEIQLEEDRLKAEEVQSHVDLMDKLEAKLKERRQEDIKLNSVEEERKRQEAEEKRRKQEEDTEKQDELIAKLEQMIEEEMKRLQEDQEGLPLDQDAVDPSSAQVLEAHQSPSAESIQESLTSSNTLAEDEALDQY